jgi:hypothetical protein
MSGSRPAPWWYSGDDAEDASAAPQPEDAGGGGLDWMSLLGGAARVVDWAAGAVLAPHAEHDVPAEHPQCVVCRGILLVTEASGTTAAPAASAPQPAEPIRWLPVVDDPPRA